MAVILETPVEEGHSLSFGQRCRVEFPYGEVGKHHHIHPVSIAYLFKAHNDTQLSPVYALLGYDMVSYSKLLQKRLRGMSVVLCHCFTIGLLMLNENAEIVLINPLNPPNFGGL